MAEWLNRHTLSLARSEPAVVPSFTFYPEPGVEDYVGRALREGGAVAKVHLQVGKFDANHPLLDSVWSDLAARGVPVILHAGAVPDGSGGEEWCGVGPVRRLLDRFPDLRLVIAHLGAPDFDDFLTLAAEAPSLRLDTAMVFGSQELLGPAPVNLAERLGGLRAQVLFGSDFPTILDRFPPSCGAWRRSGWRRLGCGRCCGTTAPGCSASAVRPGSVMAMVGGRSRSRRGREVSLEVAVTSQSTRTGQAVRKPGPEPLWTPSEERIARSKLTAYRRWLAETGGLRFPGYQELWEWSVSDLDAFWRSIWEFFEVGEGEAPSPALAERRMPGASWFPGARLNHAELALRRRDGHPAIVAGSEDGSLRTITRAELAEMVAAAAEGLRRLGVRGGDRVAAYLPNVPETVVTFLATVSIGAIWSSCAPEFGVSSVVDRFQQIEPKVLLAVEGYRYGGRWHDRREEVAAIRSQLPTLQATVLVPAPGQDAAGGSGAAGGPEAMGGSAAADGPAGEAADGPGTTLTWAELVRAAGEDRPELTFEAVPFDHPLWILYSSGTTGLPKPIVQGHGGIVLEHLKSLALHLDLGPEDRFFWFTTTGWMMWNFLVGGLLVGSTVLLYDGSPGHPDMGALWRFAEAAGMTYFGTSAAYVLACMKAGIEPAKVARLDALHSVGSTGSPLPPEGFAWLYRHVGRDILVGSISGGTDVCTAFVESCPLLPVHAGEIQCRGLGAKVEAFDERGRPVLDEVGELVITEPLPSMPLRFWNDPDGSRYRDSYFSTWPGVWRHGDWVEITSRGTVVISGRSDSTLNRGGVRMGTSEFYRVIEGLDEVTDSLVVDASEPGGEGRLLLFLVLRPGVELDDDLRRRVREAVRRELSPRHVPDELHAIGEVPRTLSGKKLEVPVKRVLAGVPLDKAVSEGALANPRAVHEVVALAGGRVREG